MLDCFILADSYAVRLVYCWLRNGGLVKSSKNYAISDRWFCNHFLQHRYLYLWRSNRRCSKVRFLKCLRAVIEKAGVVFPSVVFHEKFGGWKRFHGFTAARFIKIESLDGLITLLSRHVWNIGKEFNNISRSDNYNIVFHGGQMYLVISHENEMLLFSRNRALLEVCRNVFKDEGLSVYFEGEVPKCG